MRSMRNKATDRPALGTSGGVWPPAPLVPPPEPSAPPRRRTLTGTVWLDAVLGVPIAVVASVLLFYAAEIRYWTLDGSGFMVALCITLLVNMAVCLAVGRRFRAFAVTMAVASIIVVALLLWYIVWPICGMQFGSEGKAGE